MNDQPKRVYPGTKLTMKQGSNGIEMTVSFNLDGDELALVSLPLRGRVYLTCEVDPSTAKDIRKVPEARTAIDAPSMLQAPVSHMPVLDPVRHAAMLSRDPAFQDWVGQTAGKSDLELLPDKQREVYTANWMRERLRIASRADLAVDEQARNRYAILLSEYRADTVDGSEAS